MDNNWKLVPVEPTEEMAIAGEDVQKQPFAESAIRIYRAMLSAALTSPAQAQVDVEKLVDDFVQDNDGDGYPFKGEEYDLQIVEFAFRYLANNYHLTPKTQGDE